MFSMLVSFYQENVIIFYFANIEKRKIRDITSKICVLDDPTEPDLVLQPPHFMVSCEYNQKDPNIIAGGCYNGQVIIDF